MYPLARMSPSPESSLLFELFEGLPRLGPGTAAATRRALEAIPDLPPAPRVLDAGCGTGASTRVLAGALRGEIVAVDIHKPYLERLEREMAAVSTPGRVTIRKGDMASLPVPRGSFDLVWSEGAVYLLGFRRGLQIFGRYLKPGGALAVTELTWLVDDPPPEVRGYWSKAYPGMTTREANLETLRGCGYRLLDDFALPSQAWEAFYTPLKARLPGFLARHDGEAGAAALVESIRTEHRFFQRYGGCYSYVFYVARWTGRAPVATRRPAA